LRDCLTWLYGKGFPKSLNVANAIWDTESIPIEKAEIVAPCWEGYGTALKPAWEPVLLARKPLDGTVANNVATWGVGGLAIDACRIGDEGGTRKINPERRESVTAYGNGLGGGGLEPIDAGRWPANLLLDEGAAELLDASVAPTKSVPYRENKADGAVLPLSKRSAGGYSDSGGLSRFFYCTKVSTKERELGCESLPAKTAGECTDREDGSASLESPRSGAGRTGGAKNHHPTLKPNALTKWLASLIKPPTEDAALLIPYSGAGSEIIGALQAGWPLVFGIEGEEDYVKIAHARIAARRDDAT
jgi:site-specific DNA-methyltransferase (adenine-specific)